MAQHPDSAAIDGVEYDVPFTPQVNHGSKNTPSHYCHNREITES